MPVSGEREGTLEVRVAVLETHFKHISQQFGMLETKLDGVRNIIWGAMSTFLLAMIGVVAFFIVEKNNLLLHVDENTQQIIAAAKRLEDVSR